MIIGITGSFGSGKSTVALMFKKFGYKVINVDKFYHKLYVKDIRIKDKILKEFGTVNRRKLKEIVFSDNKKLKKLNSITHPVLIQEIKKIIKKNKKIVIDAPLLIEAKVTELVDKVIVVKASKKNMIKRILKKKKYRKKEIEQIIKSQMSLKKKLKYADYVVDNNKGLKEAKEQVKKIINLL